MKYAPLILVAAVSAITFAGEPDWPSLPITPHNQVQAVDGAGFSAFAFGNDPIVVRGILLNHADDMLDPADQATPFLGGQWQVFVQAVDPNDLGGTALFMGQNIGKLVGNHPAGSYDATEWADELNRLDHDPATGHPFRPGDLVEVRGRGCGLPFNGKFNINEQHIKDPAQDFDVILLQANVGLPAPTALTISDLKDANDQFIFDATRQTGCERYQGTLVRLVDVSFVDDSAWGPEQTLLATDGSGRTFPILLGRGAGFTLYAPPTPPFDIVGILDQEDANQADGLTGGYRLWVMNTNGAAGAIDACPLDLSGDGRTGLDDLGLLFGCWGAACGDIDGDGSTGLGDLGVLFADWGCPN